MNIVMDGKTYRVRGVRETLTESFRVADGRNTDTLITGEEVRDIIGTYYDHSLDVEPDPRYYQDYLDFYEAISAPVESHEITLPHEGGAMTYQAMIYSGSHTIKDAVGNRRRYTGLTVNFKAKAPYREPV